MGDRVLIQVVGDDGDFSPVAYGHWCGSETPGILARLKKRMKGREGDVQYTFARLLQEMTNGDKGNVSFGAWNTDHVLTAEDSHCDAGVVVINVTGGRFRCECFGGYLHTDSDGLPRVGAYAGTGAGR